MKCEGCGYEFAKGVRYTWTGSGIECSCEKCNAIKISNGVDVYFKEPYFDMNLADEKHPNGQFIHSKFQKAGIMKEQGITEAGDRKHGYRNEYEKNYGMRKFV